MKKISSLNNRVYQSERAIHYYLRNYSLNSKYVTGFRHLYYIYLYIIQTQFLHF